MQTPSKQILSRLSFKMSGWLRASASGLSRISHKDRQGRLSGTQFQYSKTILDKHLLKQKQNTLTIHNVCL